MSDIQLIQFMFPKIIAATMCGLIIGCERELKNKVAGIRTHIIVCVGSCIFTIIGVIMAEQAHSDPTRIIAQIVTGIGFLGAGVIFKQDDKVTGVTSAAFIWLMASIGVLIGIGYIWAGLSFTVGLLCVLIVLHKLEHYINQRQLNKSKTKKIMSTKKVVIGVAAGVAAFIFLPITKIVIGAAVVGGAIYGYNKLK